MDVKRTNQQNFVEVFPYSAHHFFQTKHYRLYQMYNRWKNTFYSQWPPRRLIDFSKVERTDIPVILINFNRYRSLQQLIEWLLQLDQSVSVIVMDNASSYPPLLDYYQTISNHPKVQVLRFQQNNGLRKIIPICQCFNQFDYYVLSDSDLIPYHSTPNDIFLKMKTLLQQHPHINHVGASLEIQDIPDYFPLKQEVVTWEKRFWEKEFVPNVYDAHVDTTFAMYHKKSMVSAIYPSLRLGRPYTMKHLDWYINPKDLGSEMKHLLDKISPMATWLTKLKTEIIEA